MTDHATARDSTPSDSIHSPDEWVDVYGDFLYGYAASRLRDANAAEEVVQETFLAGIRHHDQFRGEGTQRAWLLGILKHKIVDFIRKRLPSELPGAEDDESPVEHRLFDRQGSWRNDVPWINHPGRQMELEELRNLVSNCLKHVPAAQADVFVLTVMEEMNGSDVCRELGISRSNLWVRLHRARLKLADCVRSKWSRHEK